MTTRVYWVCDAFHRLSTKKNCRFYPETPREVGEVQLLHHVKLIVHEFKEMTYTEMLKGKASQLQSSRAKKKKKKRNRQKKKKTTLCVYVETNKIWQYTLSICLYSKNLNV